MRESRETRDINVEYKLVTDAIAHLNNKFKKIDITQNLEGRKAENMNSLGTSVTWLKKNASSLRALAVHLHVHSYREHTIMIRDQMAAFRSEKLRELKRLSKIERRELNILHKALDKKYKRVSNQRGIHEKFVKKNAPNVQKPAMIGGGGHRPGFFKVITVMSIVVVVFLLGLLIFKTMPTLFRNIA